VGTTGRAKAHALREHAREAARTRHKLAVRTSGPCASRAQGSAPWARWAELEATPGPSRREQGTAGRAGKHAGSSEHGRARTRPATMPGRGRRGRARAGLAGDGRGGGRPSRARDGAGRLAGARPGEGGVGLAGARRRGGGLAGGGRARRGGGGLAGGGQGEAGAVAAGRGEAGPSESSL
jgi:hypothetical protein